MRQLRNLTFLLFLGVVLTSRAQAKMIPETCDEGGCTSTEYCCEPSYWDENSCAAYCSSCFTGYGGQNVEDQQCAGNGYACQCEGRL
jgi:hypothetical protein